MLATLLGGAGGVMASDLPPCPSSGYFHNCFGTYTWDDTGEIYAGEWKDDKRHGQGTFIWADGEKYVGEYKDGKRTGKGTYTYASGDKYVGEYKDGVKSGQGTYIYANGFKEIGEWADGKLNGYAIRYDADGSVLKEGIWKDDEFLYVEKRSENTSPPSENSNVDIEFLEKKYPRCENIYYRHECFAEHVEDNVKWIGYFRNNSLWDGQYFQNDVLLFEYFNGEKNSKSSCIKADDGWMVCPSGNRFKPSNGGYFDKNNYRQGKFIYEYIGGDKYVGEYKDDIRHGNGTYLHANGDKYVGEYKNGAKHGQGTFTYKNGSKEIGEWAHGVLHGYAEQYNADGSLLRAGIFKNDEFQYAEKRSENTNSSSGNPKLDKHKEFCEEIGFTPGTEKFAECVMVLIDTD